MDVTTLLFDICFVLKKLPEHLPVSREGLPPQSEAGVLHPLERGGQGPGAVAAEACMTEVVQKRNHFSGLGGDEGVSYVVAPTLGVLQEECPLRQEMFLFRQLQERSEGTLAKPNADIKHIEYYIVFSVL